MWGFFVQKRLCISSMARPFQIHQVNYYQLHSTTNVLEIAEGTMCISCIGSLKMAPKRNRYEADLIFTISGRLRTLRSSNFPNPNAFLEPQKTIYKWDVRGNSHFLYIYIYKCWFGVPGCQIDFPPVKGHISERWGSNISWRWYGFHMVKFSPGNFRTWSWIV